LAWPTGPEVAATALARPEISSWPEADYFGIVGRFETGIIYRNTACSLNQ
jgi:hypothetical protein